MLLTAAGCAAQVDGEGKGDTAAGAAAAQSVEAPRRLAVRVVATYPHDREAWTQGLLWHDGSLYESLGLNGRSAVRRVELASGRVEREVKLPDAEFGEGLALLDGVLHQLTWRSGRGHRWQVGDLASRGGFTYPGEGWGLCAMGDELIRSDGTARLYFHRGDDFALVRTLSVERQGRPQTSLNELECVNGWVYANVWTTDELVRIDPASGRVTAVIDAAGLLPAGERAGAEVLNGIAFYPPNRTFLLTGKLWPKLFEVSFVEADG